MDAYTLGLKKEVYQSIYRFNESILENKSLGNLKKGTLFYADFLVFDIDSTKLQKAHEAMIMLSEQLDMIEASYELWFSGSKGFHVMVPTCQFGFEPTSDESILKNMAMGIAQQWKIETDEKIYNATRILRVPGSYNRKGGFYKVPITASMGLDSILELAKEPQENPYPEPDDYGTNDTLTKVYRRVINAPKVNRVILPEEEPKKGRSLFVRAEEGNRNDKLYKLARSLARRSIVEADALFICGAWSDSLPNPIDPKELQKTVVSAYSKGINEMVDESNLRGHFYDASRALASVQRLISNLKHNIIKTGYRFLDDYTMGMWKGDVVYIIARPGNFKTCIASSILQGISKTTGKKTIFFSMEMSATRLSTRHMQFSEGMGQVEIIEAIQRGHKFDKYKEDFKDVVVVDLSSLTIEMVLGLIDYYIEEFGEIGAICFDYLSLFKGATNNTEATARYATELKSRVAKAGNCVTFCLVQGKREYEGDGGNIEIDKVAGKDSSSIEDSADFIIGAWNHEGKNYGRFLKGRAFNGVKYHEDPYFTLEIDKPHMRLRDIKVIPKGQEPQFKQLERKR